MGSSLGGCDVRAASLRGGRGVGGFAARRRTRVAGDEPRVVQPDAPRRLCSRPDDILPLVEAFVTEEATFAKIAAGAAKHGYLVDADDGRRARAAAANLAGGKRRAGVRVETVAHVQARLRGRAPGKLREAARQALFTLDPPIRDGLEAGWALAATPNGDARGGIGPAASTDRAVAERRARARGRAPQGSGGEPARGLRPAVPR